MDKFAKKLNNLAYYLHSTGFRSEAKGVLHIKTAAGVGMTSCATTEKCSKWKPVCGGEKTGTILLPRHSAEYPVLTVREKMSERGSFIDVETITGTENLLRRIPGMQQAICDSLSGTRNGRPGRRYDVGEAYDWIENGDHYQGPILEAFRVKDLAAVNEVISENEKRGGSDIYSEFRGASYARLEELGYGYLHKPPYGITAVLALVGVVKYLRERNINIPSAEDYGRNLILNVRDQNNNVGYHHIKMPISNQFSIKGVIDHEYCTLNTQIQYTMSEEDFVNTCFDVVTEIPGIEEGGSRFLTDDTFTAWNRGAEVISAEEGAVVLDRYELSAKQEKTRRAPQSEMLDYSITLSGPETVGFDDSRIVSVDISPPPSQNCFVQIFYTDNQTLAGRGTTWAIMANRIRDGKYSAGLDFEDINIDSLTGLTLPIKYYAKITCGSNVTRSTTKTMVYERGPR